MKLKDRSFDFGEDIVIDLNRPREYHAITNLDHHKFTPQQTSLLKESIWEFFNFLNAKFILDIVENKLQDPTAALSTLPNSLKKKITTYIEKEIFPKKWYDAFVPQFNAAMEFDKSTARFQPQDTQFASRISKILGIDDDSQKLTLFKKTYIEKKKNAFNGWQKMSKNELNSFGNPYHRDIIINLGAEDDEVPAEEGQVEDQEILDSPTKDKNDMLASSFKPTFKQIISTNLSLENQHAVLECLEETQATATKAIMGVEVMMKQVASKVTQGTLKVFHEGEKIEDIEKFLPAVDIIVPFDGDFDLLIQTIASIQTNVKWYNSLIIYFTSTSNASLNTSQIATIEGMNNVRRITSPHTNLLEFETSLCSIEMISEHFLFWKVGNLITCTLEKSFFFTMVNEGSTKSIKPKVH